MLEFVPSIQSHPVWMPQTIGCFTVNFGHRTVGRSHESPMLFGRVIHVFWVGVRISRCRSVCVCVCREEIQ